jgi:Fe-S-cluster containining protein
VSEKSIETPAVQVQRRTPEVLKRIEERCAGLLPRVEAKLKTISGLDRTPEKRLVEQAARAGTVAKRVMWLRKAADYLQDGAAHLAACRKGCSHCCHISVMVSRAEAQVIAKETGARLNVAAGRFSMQGFEEQLETIQSATLQTYGEPCTFLRAGACSIYASRPLQCRLLLNLDEDDLLCQLIENCESNVPYLNTTQHHIASVSVLGAHQDYDDLRNWFPE